MFLNNVSVGIYGDAVQRPGYRSAKLRTMLGAADRVLDPSAVAGSPQLLTDVDQRATSDAMTTVRSPGRKISSAGSTCGLFTDSAETITTDSSSTEPYEEEHTDRDLPAGLGGP